MTACQQIERFADMHMRGRRRVVSDDRRPRLANFPRAILAQMQKKRGRAFRALR